MRCDVPMERRGGSASAILDFLATGHSLAPLFWLAPSSETSLLQSCGFNKSELISPEKCPKYYSSGLGFAWLRGSGRRWHILGKKKRRRNPIICGSFISAAVFTQTELVYEKEVNPFMSAWWMSYSVCVIRTTRDGVDRCFSRRLWPAVWCMGDFSVAATRHYSNCIGHNFGHACPGVAVCLMTASKWNDTEMLKRLAGRYLELQKHFSFYLFIFFQIVCPFQYEPTALVSPAAGKHRPGERSLWDGGNEEKRGPHPDGRHAGDGDQPPQSVGRADAQANGCGDSGEPSGKTLWRTACPRVARRQPARKWKMTRKTNAPSPSPNAWQMAN